jgi:hypothetical protein
MRKNFSGVLPYMFIFVTNRIARPYEAGGSQLSL